MTYREKLRKCGIKVEDSITEQEAKETWDELAEIIDRQIAKQEKKRKKELW